MKKEKQKRRNKTMKQKKMLKELITQLLVNKAE